MRFFNLLRNINNWWDYIFYKIGISKKYPIIFKCNNNVIVEVPKRLLHTFKEVFFDDFYIKYISPSQLKNQPVNILDIGANTGYFSLLMFAKHPKSKIIAFEPIPENYELLQKHKAMNSAKDFTIVNKAVYGDSGNIKLQYNSEDSFTTGASVFNNTLGNDEIEVETITLPEIIDTYKLNTIQILKMDCEGAEYNIFYNCPEKYFSYIRYIALECHNGETKKENITALCDFLKSKGYFVETSNSGMLWAWRNI